MIVVSGATGNVGRPLVRALADAGEQVTAVSRGVAPVAPPETVRHHRGDLAEPESLRPAFAGAGAFFLLVSGAGAHLDAHAIVDVVKSAGVPRIVLLSSQAASTRPRSVSHAPLRAIEEIIENSGLEWTHLRPGGFASNTLAWAPSVKARREIAAPFADVALPVVDPQDIAEAAAVVLTRGGHGGKAYELTGPEATTARQRAQLIGDALGEPLTFIEQTREEAQAQLLQFMPAPVVEGTLSIIGEPTPQEQRVSPDVQTLLGRPPYGYGDWARRNIAAFRLPGRE
jgi:uncharacterized protein YbjT (DUF2867 family)